MISAGDTIYALSSAPGRAGVAVIRVSGPAVRQALARMSPPVPHDRQAAFRTVRHPLTKAELDQAVVLFFAGPRSETGEDVAEFQVHGGRAIVRAVLDALSAVPECRLAEPGEFARRAFENGKLDLTAAEGLADLVEAETECQRQQALRQAKGALSRLYEDWRSRLIEAAALVEAAIDFSDEADVSGRAFDMAVACVRELEPLFRRHLDDAHRGEILRDGFRVVLAGPPNSGKSSLLNALARRDVAIVSSEAGTTRDVIEVRLDLGGLPVVVCDTAGLREAEGAVEREGIRRTLERTRDADVIIWLIDTTQPVLDPPAELQTETSRILRVLSKSDLAPAGQIPGYTRPIDGLAMSARTGEGLAELAARLSALAAERVGTGSDPVITQSRHRRQVEACAEGLNDFLTRNPAEIELRAEDLRRAAHALGRLTGRVDVEDVLDQVFMRFCIGK
ncbi:MAG: tRNA uridine-5-carboxymethylaminomethyl(34) synthesis GTPase MnmE [Hyphomicrobium sp.]